MFDSAEEAQVRIRLADTIKWIVCQRLLPKIGGGRIAAFEILGTGLRTKDAILHGESEGKTFYEIIESGEAFGMTTLTDALYSFMKRSYNKETAMAYSSHKGVVGRGIDSVKSSRGEATSDISSSELDEHGKY